MDGSQELMVFQALGRIEEALAELRGPKGRIAVLEDDADKIAPLVEKHERIVMAASFFRSANFSRLTWGSEENRMVTNGLFRNTL